MFNSTVVKWLTIIGIVLIGFLVMLLFLGYLLKENEVKTIQLKAKLANEAMLEQAQETTKNSAVYSQITLSAFEKSQQKIIENNLDCQSDKQCFLVQTDSENVGCIVAVNTTGAVILLKVTSTKKHQSSKNFCLETYQQAPELSAKCSNNLCVL
jgi:hypothetical protein